MTKQNEETGPIVVSVPLRTILISLLGGLAVAFWVLALGPAKWIDTWFESKAMVMEAEALKRSIEIVGADNYFRRCDVGSRENSR